MLSTCIRYEMDGAADGWADGKVGGPAAGWLRMHALRYGWMDGQTDALRYGCIEV